MGYGKWVDDRMLIFIFSRLLFASERISERSLAKAISSGADAFCSRVGYRSTHGGFQELAALRRESSWWGLGRPGGMAATPHCCQGQHWGAPATRSVVTRAGKQGMACQAGPGAAVGVAGSLFEGGPFHWPCGESWSPTKQKPDTILSPSVQAKGTHPT